METNSMPTVYIGKKNMSYYVNVCLKLLEKGNNKFIIEGLGSNIRKAVDAANFLMLFYKKGRLIISKVDIDMVEKGIIRGLPKKVSRIRIEIDREINTV
jgi:DNA-binding protein Alba